MNDEWITQQYVFDWIQKRLFFQMVLDLAADCDNSKCQHYITEQENALKHSWKDKLIESLLVNGKIYNNHGCWCNPPYSKPNLPRFTEKACLEAEKGLNQCFLVPLDITSWSRNYVWGRAEVWIPDERIAYIDPETGEPQTQPPKGSMVVIYGPIAQKGLIRPVHIPKPGATS